MELVDKVTDIINKRLSDLKYCNARGKVSLELAKAIIPIIREEIKNELESNCLDAGLKGDIAWKMFKFDWWQGYWNRGGK